MAWYDGLIPGRRKQLEEKLNPAQPFIAREEGFNITSREVPTNYRNAYEQQEVVNRGVNMIVDDVSEIPTDVGEKIVGLDPIIKNIRKSRVNLLLNIEPNPFQDINSFKRSNV